MYMHLGTYTCPGTCTLSLSLYTLTLFAHSPVHPNKRIHIDIHLHIHIHIHIHIPSPRRWASAFIARNSMCTTPTRDDSVFQFVPSLTLTYATLPNPTQDIHIHHFLPLPSSAYRRTCCLPSARMQTRRRSHGVHMCKRISIAWRGSFGNERRTALLGDGHS
jgi:hypothetical protein